MDARLFVHGAEPSVCHVIIHLPSVAAIDNCEWIGSAQFCDKAFAAQATKAPLSDDALRSLLGDL